jgi:hypothetical protein
VYTNISGKKCSVHRLIVSADEGDEVDHISGDRLDNRRCNLRFCTHAENQKNMKLSSSNKTGYKGVFLPKRRKQYVASIRIDGRSFYLGSYGTAEEAAGVYDAASKILHGDFSRPNGVPPLRDTLQKQIEAKIGGLLSGGLSRPRNEDKV